MSHLDEWIDHRRVSMETYQHETTQIALKINRDLYVRFKAGCILRDTNPTRLINIWIEKQVEAWHQDMRKELLPHPQDVKDTAV